MEMTEEELNRIEAVVRKRAALGDIDSEPSLSLIALARVGLAFQNAIKEAENRRDAQDGLAVAPKPEDR